METVIKFGWLCIVSCILVIITTIIVCLHNFGLFEEYNIISYAYIIGIAAILFVVLALCNEEQDTYYVFKDEYGILYTVNNYEIIQGKYYIYGYVSTSEKGFIKVSPIKKCINKGFNITLLCSIICFSIIMLSIVV